ncbi:protein transport protein bos1 [Phlyctochytrium bullatum]|nr:protein transport protein bos1 [Phlyctochytrium bullatum]
MSGNLLFNNAMKLVNQLKSDLDTLEASLEGLSSGSSVAVSQAHSNLQSLKRAAEDIDDMARREITTVKREKALSYVFRFLSQLSLTTLVCLHTNKNADVHFVRRASQVREEYAHLKSRYEAWKSKDAAKTAAQQRNELLGTSGMTQRTGHSTPNGTEKPVSDTSTILMMDGLLKENEVLQSSGERLDEFIALGRTALQELYEQRTMLKSTQRRMLDIFNQLGLSTTVIRYIEQRTQQDKWVLFGGIVITVLIMWAIVHYLR